MPQLLTFPVSMFSQKVVAACFEMSVDVELEEVNPLTPEGEARLAPLTPWGRAPILIADDGIVVHESSIIVEFLNRFLPPGACGMLPNDPAVATEVRYVDRIVDCYFIAPLRRLFYSAHLHTDLRTPRFVDAAHEQVESTLVWLDGRLAQNEYLVGDAISLADCAAAAGLCRAASVHEFSHLPLLSDYWIRLSRRPSLVSMMDMAASYCLRTGIDPRVEGAEAQL